MILNLPKSFDEVQQAQLMPEEWYVLRISEDPKVEPNKHARAMEKGEDYDASKVGNNLVIRMRVEHEDPMINGRQFTRWLSLPSEADREKTTSSGQTMEDFKMEQIRKEAEAFAGAPVEGSEVAFEPGMAAAYYVKMGEDFRSGEPANELDINIPPKPWA